MSAGLVMLAAIVVVVLVSPASPRSDGDVSGDAAVRWPPPTRAVERARAEYLAALFHPDGPNDLAPAAYNLRTLEGDLPRSPLAVQRHPTGFRWGAYDARRSIRERPEAQQEP